MSRPIVQVAAVSLVVSSVISTAVTLAVIRLNSTNPAQILQVKRVEIMDSEGRIRGIFGFSDHKSEATVPRLTLLHFDGRESVRLSTDPHGNSELEFASDRWNEGAVILGHLEMSDEAFDSGTGGQGDNESGWGLMVRSRANAFTRMGFLDSGQAIAPTQKSTSGNDIAK